MIAIIDYGMGNVGSVKNALLALGFESVVTRDPGQIASAAQENLRDKESYFFRAYEISKT